MSLIARGYTRAPFVLMLAASLSARQPNVNTPAPRLVVGWTHEPAGMTVISDDGFSSLGYPWRYTPSHASARIVADTTAPESPTNVLQFDFPVGYTGGGYAPARVDAPSLGTNRRQIYWGFVFKANASWQDHLTGVNKLGYGWLGDTTFGLTWYWARESRGGEGATKMLSVFVGPNYYHFNRRDAFSLEPGAWYKVEVYLEVSSAPGAADGSVRVWVNDTLCSEYVGIVTPTGVLKDIYFAPTWGGTGGVAKLHDDYLRFDHVRLSVK
jgi:hypothetical protein